MRRSFLYLFLQMMFLRRFSVVREFLLIVTFSYAFTGLRWPEHSSVLNHYLNTIIQHHLTTSKINFSSLTEKKTLLGPNFYGILTYPRSSKHTNEPSHCDLTGVAQSNTCLTGALLIHFTNLFNTRAHTYTYIYIWHTKCHELFKIHYT